RLSEFQSPIGSPTTPTPGGWAMRITAWLGKRIDWPTLRDQIDLATLTTNLLGPASGRRGQRGGLWWHCPLGTQEDRNHSLLVRQEKRRWHCFGCGQTGDAASLVMQLKGLSFPDTLRFLAGEPFPSREVSHAAATRLQPRPKPQPEEWQEWALAIVQEAEGRL